jgi:arginyl-tRNA synthetase
MNALAEIKSRFSIALKQLCAEETEQLLEMIRPAQDSRFGDYQVNSAMSLGKRLSRPPRDVAADLVARVEIDDFCKNSEIAGPGFINLTLDEDWIKQKLTAAARDPQLGVAPTNTPKTFVIDFSSPNVAKPMHVGHIRSTVIGDALARILRFAGHQVITDNHLGDWGTQFGMIIYGYKNFADEESYNSDPIEELLRLYRQVRQIIDFHKLKIDIPAKATEIVELQKSLEQLRTAEVPSEKPAAKKHRKEISRLESKIKEASADLELMKAKVAEVVSDPAKLGLFNKHAGINDQVLAETAKLHSGDAENFALWKKFLPVCRADIQRIYDRLDIEFDFEHGESFYHDQLADVVKSLEDKKIAIESDGATCVFLDHYDAPMIIRKKDGAFLYSTSDLATIQYRMQNWSPAAMLYVVDHRQHEHFGKLFAAARHWGYDDVEFQHISFGTILGDDGKPFQTRAGDTVGLEGLLDEAVERAYQVVSELDDKNKDGSQIDPGQRKKISEVVGIGALKYADLSQNRMSDYKFSYEKMVSLKGNTATYLQYCYARVQGVYRKGDIDPAKLRDDPQPFVFEKDIERTLAVQILRFAEAIDEVMVDYKPNLLAQYLYELTETFFKFYDQCPVLEADDAIKNSRLQLCDLTARTIKTGLSLLGIGVVDRM